MKIESMVGARPKCFEIHAPALVNIATKNQEHPSSRLTLTSDRWTSFLKKRVKKGAMRPPPTIDTTEKVTHRIGTRRPVHLFTDRFNRFDTLILTLLSLPCVASGRAAKPSFGPRSIDSLVSGSTKVKMMEAMGATTTRPHTSASFTWLAELDPLEARITTAARTGPLAVPSR